MNQEEEYLTALELASTSRYGEAESKLKTILEAHPGHIDTLILLGKVEYYLRHYAASRARFETVLLYNPENITAYFGLQYFRERSRNLRSAVLPASVLFFLVVMGIVLFFTLNSSYAGRMSSFAESLLETEDSLYRELTRLERFVEEDAASRILADKHNSDRLMELSEKLDQSTDNLEAFQRNTQTQIETLGNIITRQNEFQTSLNLLIENLLRDIQNLRVEAYRFR